MRITALAFASLLLSVSAAQAEDYLSPTNERVQLSIGAMRVSAGTNLLLDSSAGLPGTAIDAEDQFGLASATWQPKFGVVVRAGSRHRLRFDYFSLDRSGESTLNRATLVFKDVVFIQGDPIQSTMNLRTLGITYEYSFIHRERFELAAAVGLNDTDISLRARVQTEYRHIDQLEDQAGPLPTVGLDGTYVLSKRFYLDGRVQYFKASINHLDGLLEKYELSAQYRWRANIAVALGYTSLKAYVDSRQSGNSGYLNFRTRGPELFVRVGF